MGCTCIYSAFPLDKLAVLTLQTKAEAEHKRFKACSMEYGLNIITRINCLQNRFSIKAVEPIVVPTLIQGLLEDGGNSGNNNNNKNNNNNNNGDGDAGDSGEGNDWNVHHWGFPWSYYMGALFSFHSQGDHVPMIQRLLENRKFLFCMLSMFSFLSFSQLGSAIALGRTSEEKEVEYKEVVWEIRGSDCRQLIRDSSKDEFVVVGSSSSSMGSSSSLSKNSIQIGDMKSSLGIQGLWFRCKELFMRLMLPDGFPHSVTSDYLEYSLWRGVQGVASQISGVLATQSLLYAVGLGKGAIPTAAAINWVLKDGIGYVSKIMLSKYGRHFDVNPKGWRLFADLLENTAYGLEMLTPAFPHLFVFIGATAGAARSAAALIQAATRSCFYAGFAAKRNFAEVIAKGEAQGMVSKSIGIMLGIALANRIGSSTPLALVAFGVVTCIHMFCNLKSYQSIQLRTLNPYRASLVFSEYLLSGQVPSVRDINNEEPLFPAVPILDASLARKSDSPNLSPEAKSAASEIQRRLHLGSKLSDVIYRREDAVALFDLYRNENYMLTEHDSNFCVILKRSASPVDLLRSLYHVTYLYWLERNAGIKSTTVANDCRPGGKLQISLDYVQREFNHLRDDCDSVGWVTDALISRPSPNRISLDVASSTET